MKIDHIFDQGSGSVNEDQLLINTPTFAVFDGATSLDRYVNDEGMTGALLASMTAKEYFKKSDASLIERTTEANQALRERMERASVGITDKGKLWATTVASVALQQDSFEWLTISDSVILAIDHNDSHRLIGEHLEHDEENLRLWKQHANKGVEDIYKKMNKELLANRHQMNIEYGVLDGEPEALSFIQHGTEPLVDIKHLILFTDGLFLPSEEPWKQDWNRFVELYLAGGLKGVLSEVRSIEASDPKMLKYPRFKCSDDAAAISITFDV